MNSAELVQRMTIIEVSARMVREQAALAQHFGTAAKQPQLMLAGAGALDLVARNGQMPSATAELAQRANGHLQRAGAELTALCGHCDALLKAVSGEQEPPTPE